MNRKVGLVASLVAFLAFASVAHGGELGNLVVMLSDGKPSANRQNLPEIFCKLRKRSCSRIVGAFVDRIGGEKKRITIIEQRENRNKCHSCEAILSLYAYVQLNPREINSKWVLESKFKNFAEAGTWGVAEPSNLHIFKINNSLRILYIKSGFMNQGVVEGGVSFYKLTPTSIKHIGSFFTTSVSLYGIMRDIDFISNWEAKHKIIVDGDKVTIEFSIKDEIFGENTKSQFVLKGDRLVPVGAYDERLRPQLLPR